MTGVLDVRPVEEYTAEHIPGTISIPLDQLDDRLTEGMLEWRLADLPIAPRDPSDS